MKTDMLRSIGKQSGESVESVTACSVHLSAYVLFVPHFTGYKSLNFKRFCFSDVNAILISLSFSSARDAASVRFVPSVRKPMCKERWLWNTLPVGLDICQLSPGSINTHIISFRFI